jgi:hypothetical protein
MCGARTGFCCPRGHPVSTARYTKAPAASARRSDDPGPPPLASLSETPHSPTSTSVGRGGRAARGGETQATPPRRERARRRGGSGDGVAGGGGRGAGGGGARGVLRHGPAADGQHGGLPGLRGALRRPPGARRDAAARGRPRAAPRRGGAVPRRGAGARERRLRPAGARAVHGRRRRAGRLLGRRAVGALRDGLTALDAGALRRAQGVAHGLPPQRAHLRPPARAPVR